MSVGYGTHKKGRPLSPVEVGSYLQRARDSGVTLKECATELQLDGTGHIGRFLHILKLPEDIQHLINWGSGKDFIGFSSAVELTKLQCADDQILLSEAIMENGLKKAEVSQIVQLRNRSGHPISDCISEILGMREIIEKRYVYIGALNDAKVQDAIDGMMQKERDIVLDSALQRLGLRDVSGRLGKHLFTLVGGDQFNESMNIVGKQNIERNLRSFIAEAVENVRTDC